jgi:hypothetical protein
MRVDYYPLVSKAASTLTDDVPDVRHVLFERVRVILVNELRRRQPPASRFEIMRQRAALETAIRRVDLELRIRSRGSDSEREACKAKQNGQLVRALVAKALASLVNQLRFFRSVLAFIFRIPRVAIESSWFFVAIFRWSGVFSRAFVAVWDRTIRVNKNPGATYLRKKSIVLEHDQTNEAERATSTIIGNLAGIQLLDRFMLDAAQPRVPDNIRQDARTMLNWLGVERAEEISAKHYDHFSCAVQGYMLECREQSLRLAPTTANPRSALNDDIRDVLNRLLEREQTERITDQALAWFSAIWIFLYIVLNVIVVLVIFAVAPTLRSAVAELTDVYDPLHASAWISQVLAMTPALLSIGWRNRRLKRTVATRKKALGANVEMAVPEVRDIAAPLVA